MVPLRLTPWESLALAVDQPAYPMQFRLRAIFAGEMERHAWSEALRSALLRHPLLCARLEQPKEGGPVWKSVPVDELPVTWIDDESFAGRAPIDLSREIGARLQMVQSDVQQSVALLDVHHACCDALGALQFLHDASWIYAHRHHATPPSLPETIPSRLNRRSWYGRTWWEWLRRLPQDSLALLGFYEFWFHRPMALGQPRQADHSEAPPAVPGVADPVVHLPARVTGDLRARARSSGVTLNDLLATALFEVLDETLVDAAVRKTGNVIRLTMPVSLRRPDDQTIPAANWVSLFYLDRQPGRSRSPQALLRSVHWEMALCKAWNAGLTMIRFLGLRHLLTRQHPAHGRRDSCLSTAVMSNLCELSSVWDWPASGSPLVWQLIGLEFSPPILPLTAVALGVVTVRGQMSVTLNYDRTRLTDVAAQAFLERYRDRLLEWVRIPV